VGSSVSVLLLIVGAYFCMNMILITLSSFLAIIVINTHIRGDRKNEVPNWLRRVRIYTRPGCITLEQACKNDTLYVALGLMTKVSRLV